MSPETADALDMMFEGALKHADWSVGLDALACSLGAAGGVIMPKTPSRVELGVPVGGAIADVLSLFVSQGWHRNDLRGIRGWPLIEKGQTVLLEHDLSSDEERHRNPYYQEFFRSVGLPWIGVIGFTLNGEPWCLSLLRGAGQGHYDRSDTPMLAEVRPYLARILKLRANLAASVDENAIAMLDLEGRHGLAIDDSGKVVWVSSEAISFINPQIAVSSNRIVAHDRRENQVLQEIITLAISAPKPSQQRARSSVLIRRDIGDDFLVEVVAMPKKSRDVFSRASAMVFFRPLDLRRTVEPELLMGLFGLTRQEAKVVGLIATGIGAVDAAHKLEIGHETARTFLSRAFAKMGVSRQSELTLLVSKLL